MLFDMHPTVIAFVFVICGTTPFMWVNAAEARIQARRNRKG